jgi:Mg/Co/Ni transporter MgtE
MLNDICFLTSVLLNLINLFTEEMRTISIELDKNQFIRILNKLDDSDKLEIFNQLKKSLFLKRFNKLLKSTRTNELTLEEITKEVESVRKRRYEKKKQEI